MHVQSEDYRAPWRAWDHSRRVALTTAAAVLLALVPTLRQAYGQAVTQPKIQNVSVLQGTNSKALRMWIPTQVGANVTTEFRSQPNSGSWSQLTNFPGNGASAPVSDNILGASRRFYRVAVDPRPWIRTQTASRNAYAGETVQLDVSATGMLPIYYQWSGPGGTVTNSTRITGATTATLLISNLDPSDTGNYYVTITNAFGMTSSVPAGIRITLSQAPRILIDPQSQNLIAGQNVSLWSAASGAPPLAYQWYAPAGLVTNDARITGSTTTNLSITGLQLPDEGGYTLVVSNSYGMTTSAVATVRVQTGQPPRITADPSSQTIPAGQTATLLVTATGTAPLAYFWQGPSGALTNGARIAGATTASMSISNFQFSDNGAYSVTITNAFGAATSASANVRVQ